MMSSKDFKLRTMMKLAEFVMRRAPPVVSRVPMSTLISDDVFALGKGRYVLDSVLWANDPKTYAGLRKGGHLIAGITCDNARYVARSWRISPWPHVFYIWDVSVFEADAYFLCEWSLIFKDCPHMSSNCFDHTSLKVWKFGNVAHCCAPASSKGGQVGSDFYH